MRFRYRDTKKIFSIPPNYSDLVHLLTHRPAGTHLMKLHERVVKRAELYSFEIILG